MKKTFRPCAGIVVFNKDGLLFLGNRLGLKNAWQFPQGGIEDGETISEAAQRELFEETGIKNISIVHVEKEAIRYEFDEDVKSKFKKKGIVSDGQDIYFSLFYFEGTDEEINLKCFEQEFDHYVWSDFDFAINNVISFKKEVYQIIAEKFNPLIKQYLKSNS